MNAPHTHTKGDIPGLSRRGFLQKTGAAAVGLSILAPELVRGTAANAKLDLGLIGCGNRGKWILKFFLDHGGFNVVACADYFADRTDAVGDQYGIPANRRFTGLAGYRRMLEHKLDAVVIESPPYFHPEQAAAAVAAGKHVFLAKPIAVDVAGCLSIEGSGRLATANRLCFLVDFQARAMPLLQETAAEVHKGTIGRIVCAEAAYHCGTTWEHMSEVLRQDPKNLEARLRAWGLDRVLSGDVITEQNIHALDMATWLLNAAPLRAYGTGGKQRDTAGDCWDHFGVIFYFPNDVILTFNSRQFGHAYDDIMARVYGLDGTAALHYGKAMIRSREFYNAGEVKGIYADGVTANVATFHSSIIRGDFSNPTVAPSVRSNLTTILGRTAAYKNRVVSWQEMFRRSEKFEMSLKGLKT